MITRNNLRIGQVLIEAGIVSSEDLEKGLKEQKKSGKFLCTALIELGLAQEDVILPVLAKQLNMPLVKINTLNIDPEVISKVPAKFALHYKLIPLSAEGNAITLAVT